MELSQWIASNTLRVAARQIVTALGMALLGSRILLQAQSGAIPRFPTKQSLEAVPKFKFARSIVPKDALYAGHFHAHI